MLLEHLAIPGLKYEILESSNRIGGRIYTHHFSKDKHQYFDVGAMRCPRIPAMDRSVSMHLCEFMLMSRQNF
jgi:monoamine oxidase